MIFKSITFVFMLIILVLFICLVVVMVNLFKVIKKLLINPNKKTPEYQEFCDNIDKLFS